MCIRDRYRLIRDIDADLPAAGLSRGLYPGDESEKFYHLGDVGDAADVDEFSAAHLCLADHPGKQRPAQPAAGVATFARFADYQHADGGGNRHDL